MIVKTHRYLAIFMLTFSLGHAEESSVLTASTADAGASFAADTGLFQALRVADEFINAGRQGTQGNFHQAVVIPFQLPAFGPVANPFASASFTFRCIQKQNTGGASLDLYGLAPRSSATVLPAEPSATDPGDYYMGPDDPAPGVVKIQDNIFTNAISANTTVTTNEAGSAALADYLNASYQGGAGAGSWVFLRLSLDSVPGGVNRYAIASANATTEANRPFITYELVEFTASPQLTITPATPPATGFDLEWESRSGKLYNLRTSTDLNGAPPTWEILEGEIVATPPANNFNVDPPDARRFYAVEEFDAPPLFSWDFEEDGGGFIVIGAPNDWAWGTPASDNGFGLVLTSGNDGSAGAWATNPGTGGTPSGNIDLTANSILRSPDFALAGISGARLTFAAAYDAAAGDVIEIVIKDAATGDPIGDPIIPIDTTSAIFSNWATLGPFDLSAADNTNVYLEFRYEGTDASFIGLYIDDVTISP